MKPSSIQSNNTSNVHLSQNHPAFVYWVGIVAGLAGLLFGFDTGIIAGALPMVSQEFQLDPAWQGYVVGAVLLGAIPGVILAGISSRRYGRKNTVLGSAVIFAITALLCAYAPNVYILLGTRFLLGIALGIASFVTPIYLSEMAPREVRGGLIGLYQLMITIGLLSAFLTGVAFTDIGSWRWMLGVGFGPALLMLIAFLFMPQSPRWLMLMGRKDDALLVLKRTRRNAREISEEVADIEKSLVVPQRSWDLLKNAAFRRVMFLGAGLQIMQQITGINAIMYYAPTIFASLGFAAGETVMWGAVSVGVVNVLTTIFALFVVDRVGRRPILFCGLGIMVLSLSLMAYCAQPGVINPDTPGLQWLAVGALLIYIVGFAVSLGPIVWILCAEIFPLQGRDFGVTFSTVVHWSANALLGLTFLILVRELGIDQVFGLFAFISLLSIIFVYFFVPETKHVSLEQIEFNVNVNKPLRELGL